MGILCCPPGWRLGAGPVGSAGYGMVCLPPSGPGGGGGCSISSNHHYLSFKSKLFSVLFLSLPFLVLLVLKITIQVRKRTCRVQKRYCSVSQIFLAFIFFSVFVGIGYGAEGKQASKGKEYKYTIAINPLAVFIMPAGSHIGIPFFFLV